MGPGVRVAEPAPAPFDVKAARYGQPGIGRIGDPVHVSRGGPEQVAGQFGFEVT
jgi:hypothetical protein